MKKTVPDITRSQYAIRVIDSMFDQPVFNTTDFIKFYGIPRDSGFRILNALREKKILVALRGVITSFNDKTNFHHEEAERPRRRNVWIENQSMTSNAFSVFPLSSCPL